MLQNLLSNAVKFTEKGEVRCEITCSPEGKGYKISCTVADTGLGLSIVKQLAELMGGSVSAQSDGKSGSVFSFTIYQEATQGASIRPAVAFNEGTLMRRHDELEYEIGAELLKDFK